MATSQRTRAIFILRSATRIRRFASRVQANIMLQFRERRELKRYGDWYFKEIANPRTHTHTRTRPMRRYFLVATGGGIGTLCRFGISELGSFLHFSTLAAILFINVTGCFLISFLHFLSDPSGRIYFRPNQRLFLLVGLCGGYTTFSSFSLISFLAAFHGSSIELWANILLSHFLCLVSVFLGAAAARAYPSWSRR
jgi:CrcB protein